MQKTNQQIIKLIKEDRIKFGTVSGILTTKPNLIKWVDQEIPAIELITTKSYQVKPNTGNREPIFIETNIGSYANAVGLRNPGMEQGYKELKELKDKHKLRCLLNISLSASNVDDFILLVKKFEDIADIFELNFSCPHAADGYGSSIGCHIEVVEEYIKKIRQETSKLLFPKLTPNVSNIGEIAKKAIDSGADGIVAINTVGPEIYIEPNTGKPLLNNPKDHKGGKSGKWIKTVALSKIKEIRKAVGQNIPIIGMGGISNGKDAIKMKEAGADVIGLGSVFARVKQSNMSKFVESIKQDSKTGNKTSEHFYLKEKIAKYQAHKITKIIERGNDLRIFEVAGKLNYQASQFVFIWLPTISGEKPFAIAKSKPLTFIVRKREYDPVNKKGLVTHELFKLKEGDDLIIRGIYGADAPDSNKKNVYIITGGTGIAVVPKLVEKLNKQGKNVTVYYGMKNQEQLVFEKEIKKYAKYIPVTDNGTIARVLEVFTQDLKEKNINNSCFYNIGPMPLMDRAMKIQQKMGGNKKDIFASLETNNMCGMGVCGECECGGKMVCQEGSFFSLEYLDKKEINIMKL